MPFICGQRGPKNSSFSQSLIRNFLMDLPLSIHSLFLISTVRTLRFVSNFTIKGHQIHNSDETLQTSAWEHPTDADHLITKLVSLHYRFISTCNFKKIENWLSNTVVTCTHLKSETIIWMSVLHLLGIRWWKRTRQCDKLNVFLTKHPRGLLYP